MRHKAIVEKLRSRGYTRAELVAWRLNAAKLSARGDASAQEVVDELDQTSPTDGMSVFMGFCPNSDMVNRLDIEWKERGICTFIVRDDVRQTDRFNDIWPGDLIILKKSQSMGKTMTLYGYGRVIAVACAPETGRYLKMDWSSQEQLIEVPLMGCTKTVNIRAAQRIETEMPPEFFTWICKVP